ncbi:cytochrome c oxidase assembly protein subunit 15 [Natronocella acetinitrilica]|uniref:Cytochrome c oxidase assembly protein subunit 15 n=1 Tax=Natronocella acetinitrilica TaxID=414046 RepID=A0AAE3G3P1_9GAMM|nr:COX15/CtaA family protein [Natronocella acetinitrilica]MCP1675205.1 cytochrome c oxidase assembly protein subunit 15 [Natronocella acetinitrilica]
MTGKGFFRLSVSTVGLTLIVILLGAWVRLEDAGLGCPDWPGCYGMLLGVPQTEQAVQLANQAYPERPVHIGKAWKEMIHRYAAGILGLVVFAMAIMAVRNRRDPAQPLRLPLFLGLLIVMQSILGMWTVTWQLKPLVVTLHLLGGMTTISLLWWLTIRQGRFLRPPPTSAVAERLRPWVLAVLALVGVQIALGGWVSTNYAALACTDFPLCHGRLVPEADYSEAFVLWRGLGVDYEFGILDHPARVAIHFTHRIGALIIAAAVLALAIAVWMRLGFQALAGRIAVAMVALLGVQWLLGIGNVVYSLPLAMAVAHNGGAALLLLSVLTLYHTLRPLPAAVANGVRGSG